MSWQSLAITIDETHLDEVEELLWILGAVSVTVVDAGDEPLYEPAPQETPVWRLNKVEGLFDAEADMVFISQRVEKAGFLPASPAQVLDKAWEREWLTRFKPMRFGKQLWVCPSGYDLRSLDTEDNPIRIIHLDPGLAFGTGTHPTTRLCLTWLANQDLAGRSVLDYGCGSGILAIAAAVLGARDVTGLDIDAQAIRASEENSRKNAVVNQINWVLQDSTTEKDAIGEEKCVDILVANILANPLIEMSSLLLSHVMIGGRIALSGIMSKQLNSVMSAYAEQIRFQPTVEQDGWVLLAGEKIR